MGRDVSDDTLVSMADATDASENMSPINRLADFQLREAFREARITATPELTAGEIIEVEPEPSPDKADMPKEAVDAPFDEPEPLTTTPAMEPDLAAATAEVEAVVDDGIVTAEEAREAADEAAKVLSAAAQETPDSPEPERAYDSDGEIARLVMELCDDPEEMRKMLARARNSRSDAQREAEESSGQQRVPAEVRSAAARVMSRLSQDAQESDRADGKPRRERRERVSDVELLRQAIDDCKREGRHDDVVKEVEAFLRSSDTDDSKTKSPVPLTGKYARLAAMLGKQGAIQRKAKRSSSSSSSRRAATALKTPPNSRPPRIKIVTR